MIEATAHKVKQTIQIDLPNGRRTVQERTVRNITMNGTKMIGTATLFEREVKVVWMDNLGQWRPCDDRGKYRRITIYSTGGAHADAN